jgi:hypothetical protein
MAKPDPDPDEDDPMMVVFVIHGVPPVDAWQDPLTESERRELDSHMKAMLDHEATRRIWERVQAMLAKMVVDTGDIEAGKADYAMAVQLWRLSRCYDGED